MANNASPRILHPAGTRARLTLRQPAVDYRKHRKLNPDGSYDRILGEPEVFDLHEADILKQLAKCTGKSRRKAITGGVSRQFPMHGAYMNTAAYVRKYLELNNLQLTDSFEPLSTRTQAWPDEPLFERIEDDTHPIFN